MSRNNVPAIKNPTRVTRNVGTAIDHFITNVIVGTEFKSQIIEANLSDNFPIILSSKEMRMWLKDLKKTLFKKRR